MYHVSNLRYALADYVTSCGFCNNSSGMYVYTFFFLVFNELPELIKLSCIYHVPVYYMYLLMVDLYLS